MKKEKPEEAADVKPPEAAETSVRPSADKDLGITGMDELKEKVSDVVVFGNPGAWELVCKASSQEQGWMKSTKRLQVERGYLYQTETQQRNPDGSWALSQALVYVKT